MSYYFNLEELRKEMSDSRIFTRRFETMLTFKLNSLKELCGRLPKENEAFFIETKKSFTAFTFIVYLIKHAGQVNHLYVATYSTNVRCSVGRKKDLSASFISIFRKRLSSGCRRYLNG